MKLIVFVLSIFSFLLISCDDSGIKNERFLETYKEILIVRESIADSAEANRRVIVVLEKHGYTEETFKNEFYELASENEEMVRMIDSLRNRLNRESDSLRNPILTPDN